MPVVTTRRIAQFDEVLWHFRLLLLVPRTVCLSLPVFRLGWKNRPCPYHCRSAARCDIVVPWANTKTLPEEVLPSTDHSSGTGFRPLSTTFNCCWMLNCFRRELKTSISAELIYVTGRALYGLWLYTLWVKKTITWLLITTSANADRFTKFFHHLIPGKILYNTS